MIKNSGERERRERKEHERQTEEKGKDVVKQREIPNLKERLRKTK